MQEVSRKMRDTAGGSPALPFEEAADHSRGPLGNAFAAFAAIFQSREADLAWPERSKGTKVPAYLSSTIFFIRGLNSFFNESALRGRTALPGLQRLAGANLSLF